MADEADKGGRVDPRAEQRKVFIVMIPVRLPVPGRPNFKIIGVKLNRRSAEEFAAGFPGAYIEKHFADKAAPDTAAIMRSLVST